MLSVNFSPDVAKKRRPVDGVVALLAGIFNGVRLSVPDKSGGSSLPCWEVYVCGNVLLYINFLLLNAYSRPHSFLISISDVHRE